MKRIVRLKGELILGLIISIIIGMMVAFLCTDIYRGIIYDKNKLNTLAFERNYDEVEKIKNQLNIESQNENIVYENIKRMEKILDRTCINRIFIVDKDGNVKLSTNKLPINKFDVTSGEGTNIVINENKFIATNIIKLNNESYVVYFNENNIYDDMALTQIWIIATLLILVFLITGRVKYISSISNNIREIATGNLHKRIPLKYNNELRDLAKDINYMANELHKQEVNQKEFITNISHDLRTPLTTILGYSKMIEQKVYSNEEELNRYISVINKKGDYLKGLMEDFFDYAKLSSNDIAIEKINININEIIMQLLDGEEIKLKEKSLKLELELSNKALHTLGDPMLIARALENLISNAIKYSKENTIIKICLKEEKIQGINYGLFSIRNIPKDNISNKEVNSLFKRLYKVSKSRKEEGSGLGLAITKEITKIHNGFIKVSLLGEEIKFIIGFII